MKLEINTKIINFLIIISCISIINSTVLKNMNLIKQNNSCENSCEGKINLLLLTNIKSIKNSMPKNSISIEIPANCRL